MPETPPPIPEKQLSAMRIQLEEELRRLRDAVTATALALAVTARQQDQEIPPDDEIRLDPLGALFQLEQTTVHLAPQVKELMYQYHLRLLAASAFGETQRSGRGDNSHAKSPHYSMSPDNGKRTRLKLPAVEGFAVPGSLIEQSIIATLVDPNAICTLDFIRDDISREWPIMSWEEVESLLELLVRYQILEKRTGDGVFYVRGPNYEARRKQLFESEQRHRPRRRIKGVIP